MLLHSGMGATSSPADWTWWLNPINPLTGAADMLGLTSSDPIWNPKSIDQVNAETKVAIDKAAGAGTPNYNAALSAQQYQAYLDNQASLCASDPEGCALANNPGCSSILGTGPMAVSFCANPLPWILGVVGAVALLPVLLRGGR